MREEGLSH